MWKVLKNYERRNQGKVLLADVEDPGPNSPELGNVFQFTDLRERLITFHAFGSDAAAAEAQLGWVLRTPEVYEHRVLLQSTDRDAIVDDVVALYYAAKKARYPANQLNGGISDRTRIVSCLVEGNSVRATCRMIGAAKSTFLKLLAAVNRGSLPAFRPGGSIRLDPQDVAEWLHNRRTK